MKSRATMVLGTSCLLFACAGPTGQQGEGVFLLLDVEESRWCRFVSESAWRAAVSEVGATDVATATYRGRQLEEIQVTQEAESGDWIVHDRYSFDPAGQPARLARTISILPGDRTVLEVYSLSQRVPVRAETSTKSLSTGAVMPSPAPVWLPELPISARLDQFPFAPLLDPERSRATQSCAEVSTTP